jgi:predicted RNase H-like HicB family nuclease
MTDIPITIERGKHGLYYGTSPALRGLLVAGKSIKDVMARIPQAITELRTAQQTPSE